MKEFFNQAGGVVNVRRMEGRPFGFVEFESMDAAAAAVEQLSGQELDGNMVRINLAQPKRGGGGSREVVTESDTCFVGNIDGAVEEEDLEELFDEYDYSEIRMPPGKGFAFVSFETNEAAAKAQTECNGKELKGKAIRVALAKPKAPRDDGPELEDTKPLSTFLNEDNVDRAIKLRGLPFRTTAANVLEFCKSNCEGLDYLEEKDVVMEVKEGKISGFALVFLKDEEEVDKALELDHKEIGSRWVGVSVAEMRE
jgi:RNA recognition motif-containing protein